MPLSQETIDTIIALGNEVKREYPRAFANCHKQDSPERWDFIIRFARALSVISAPMQVGLNGKRGDPTDISMDALWIGVGPHNYVVADVVAGAGGSNPQVVFQDVTAAAPGVYINPFSKNPYDYYGGPVNPTPEPPTPPLPNTDELKLRIEQLQNYIVALKDSILDLANEVTTIGAITENIKNSNDHFQLQIDDNRRYMELMFTQIRNHQNTGSHKARFF